MPPAKPALQMEPSTVAQPEATRIQSAAVAVPRPRPLFEADNSPTPAIRTVPTVVRAQPRKEASFQPRVPVISGEATYRGLLPVDGIISGHLGAAGSTLTIKQRPKSGPVAELVPELNGEITFKDMLRINGYVAGKVFSYKGTLIVDPSARVDAHIDVAVCVVSGIVNGDVIGHERVEMGPGAIINGNIFTPSLSMKPGAVFQGDCRMIKDENGDA